MGDQAPFWTETEDLGEGVAVEEGREWEERRDGQLVSGCNINLINNNNNKNSRNIFLAFLIGLVTATNQETPMETVT